MADFLSMALEFQNHDECRKAEIEDATLAAFKRYREGYMNLLVLEITLMGIGWPDHHIKRLMALA